MEYQPDPDIETVAIATDPYEARDKIIEFSPDVVVRCRHA